MTSYYTIFINVKTDKNCLIGFCIMGFNLLNPKMKSRNMTHY